MRALEAGDPALLERADAVADASELGRSEFLARALSAAIAAMAKPTNPSSRRKAG
jgi:hypothetical protein